MNSPKKPLFQNTGKKSRIQKSTIAYIALICVGIAYYIWLFITFGLAAPLTVQILYLVLTAAGIGICLLGLRMGTPFLSKGSMRQLRQPSEFRIDEVEVPKGVKFTSDTDATELCRAFETLQKTTGRNSDTSSEPADVVSKNDAVLFDLCTEIWRLKKKVAAEMQSGGLSGSQVPRYIQRIDRALESANVLIHDHVGEKYLPGQAVKVISVQQCDDIPAGQERVIETVKPTIYRDGVVVKQGEVVIGTSVTNQQKEEN